jgi:cell wall-associated NlpC family hydrolase
MSGPTMQALREQVQAEVLTWLGTPYHHCQGVHGAGVDCLMLLVRVYAACGLLSPAFDPRPYPHQWNLHRSEEIYLQGLERHGHEVPVAEAQVGDVMLWQFGRTFSHAGILVQLPGDPALQVVHALRTAREVTVQRLNDAPLAGRACRAFTLINAEA